ncbi:MAG: SDR family oxidoreductase [Candidatus Omnitrophota bacterium]|nr:SDR family oxidoreductase [Candidatus Omnitrophota bacterium]
MELGLEGKTALIVGASRGIGRAAAITLAQYGAQITAVARSKDALTSLITGLGGEAKGHLGIAKDLMPAEGPAEILRQLQEMGRDIDIVIHCLGGTLGVKEPFCDPEAWRRVFRLNLDIAVELNRYLIPLMQKRKWGRALHVSSIAATLTRGSLAYCAAKAALNAYARNLGCTVASDGVVISALMPGAVRFDDNPWDKLSKEKPEQAAAYLEERMAIKRFAKPEEISDFIAFMCSEKAEFATGAVVPIDGGSW